MIKVRHRRDAKRLVYDELSSLEEPMNKFIMQLNPDCDFSAFLSRVHSPSIHFGKEDEIRSMHFIHFLAQSMEVIALTMMTEGTMTSFDHGLFQMNDMNVCIYET